MSGPTICTVVAKNYIAFARCLTDSFLAQHPAGRVFVLLVDKLDHNFDPAQERFTTILVSEIGLPNFEQMAFRYLVFEFSTAVKPFFFEYLFDRYGCQKLCYIDPDIYFYRPVDELFELLDHYCLLLTPHLTGFLEDGFQPDELAIMRSGIYNLGFLGMGQHPELKPFLHWWQRKLSKQCVGEQERGLYLDQRWMDLVPGLFSGVFIQRDPGYNVAYWNLNHRQIEQTEAGYMANGSPLKFFHFSGLRPDQIESVARYQNRYTLDDLEHLKPLFFNYRDSVLAHGYEHLRHLPYAYDYFDNGIYIPEFARYLWRELDSDGQRWPTPFSTRGRNSFINWLNEAGDNDHSPMLTHLALETHRRRKDIRGVFPDIQGHDRFEYARWFVNQGRQDHHLDDFFIEPVATSLRKFTKTQAASTAAKAQDASSEAQQHDDYTVPSSGKVYLVIRNFLNRIGLGQRIRALVGPEQVLKIRQIFFFGRGGETQGQRDSAGPRPALNKIRARRNFLRNNGRLGQGLNVIGYLNDETGVGEVARSILKALHQQNFPVAQTAIPGYSARQLDTSTMHLPAGAPYLINLLNVNADQVPVVYENLGRTFFQNKYNIGFWFWELAHFPEILHDRFGYFDEIWVGSSFMQAALTPVAPTPVINVRVPIIHPGPATITRADLGLPPDKHLFLFVFDGLSYIERKNPLAVIQAYRSAFEPHFQDTALVIKAANLSKNPELAQVLKEEIEAVAGILIEQYMSREELKALFQACNTYVSLHRSEGFGMTIAEAMLLQKSVIATAYSANMDFMSPANSYPVDYKLVEIDQDYGPYQKGNLWAEPDIAHAAATMKHVVNNRQEAQLKGQLAKENIEQYYSAEAVSKLIIERLRIIQQGR